MDKGSPQDAGSEVEDALRSHPQVAQAAVVGLPGKAGNEDVMAAVVAVEGEAHAPSYRGLCYLVFDELPLERYGNRIPQITVEVVRRALRPEDITDIDGVPTMTVAAALRACQGRVRLIEWFM